MTDKSHDKKMEQLNMSIGKAQNQLRKMILFDFVVKCGMDACYRCGEKIESVDEFTIEHKIPWLDSDDPIENFFDLDNIAFSHPSCNYGAARNVRRGQFTHGTSGYQRKCRCDACKSARNEYKKEYRARGGAH
jgi:hypothetical protein